jgi:hypothetical protein
MNINRHNYEEYFLLYVDNELTATGKKAVEEFVQQNPDLEEELVMLQQTILHPTTHIVFDKKESLLKNVPAGLVNASNYQEYFVLYGDDELTNNEKDLVEQFVQRHSQYQQEFELIQQAKLLPDNSIVFPDKNYLYRTEEDEKVIPFPWRKLAVAAVILLFMGGFSWYVATDHKGNNTDQPKNTIARTDTGTKVKTNPSEQLAVTPATNEKKDSNDQQLRSNTIATVQDENKKAINPEKNSMAAVNELKKINPSPRHNSQEIIVPPIDQQTVVVVKAKTERQRPAESTLKPASIVTRSADINVAVNQRSEKATRENLDIPETQVVYVDAQPDDEVYADNNSSNKRPLRGLFRKVTRVFDKATNTDAGENNNKKGIRIANFEIALK